MNVATRKPTVCVLRTDGTNCDQEMAYAWMLAGARAALVHINELRGNPSQLHSFDILALPGGFSHGDAIRSGKIHALELIQFLGDELQRFVDSGKLVLGVCNGFQVLVQAGLLPDGKLGKIDSTLVDNDPPGFQCADTALEIMPTNCAFTIGYDGPITLPRANGEGQFVVRPAVYHRLYSSCSIVVKYARDMNPNDSYHDIAGICNKAGNVLGMMPHPERAVVREQLTNWRRMPANIEPPGLLFFRNGVRYAAQS